MELFNVSYGTEQLWDKPTHRTDQDVVPTPIGYRVRVGVGSDALDSSIQCVGFRPSDAVFRHTPCNIYEPAHH